MIASNESSKFFIIVFFNSDKSIQVKFDEVRRMTLISPSLFFFGAGGSVSFRLHFVIAKVVHERKADTGITPVPGAF
jgi:hypothetical protein